MMEAVCGGDKPFLSSEHLEAEHLRARDRAADVFQSRRKMGGEEFSERYQEGLMKVSPRRRRTVAQSGPAGGC